MWERHSRAESIFGKVNQKGVATEKQMNSAVRLPNVEVILGSVDTLELFTAYEGVRLVTDKNDATYASFTAAIEHCDPDVAVLVLRPRKPAGQILNAIATVEADMFSLGYQTFVADRMGSQFGGRVKTSATYICGVKYKGRFAETKSRMHKMMNDLAVGPQPLENFISDNELYFAASGDAPRKRCPVLIYAEKESAAYKETHMAAYREEDMSYPPKMDTFMDLIGGEKSPGSLGLLSTRQQEVVYYVETHCEMPVAPAAYMQDRQPTFAEEKEHQLECVCDLSCSLKSAAGLMASAADLGEETIPPLSAQSLMWLRRQCRLISAIELLRAQVGVSAAEGMEEFLTSDQGVLASQVSGFALVAMVMTGMAAVRR